MSFIEVTGGRRLAGAVYIQGSKNSVLPIMAASILNKGVTVLRGCPDIGDVNSMKDILTDIGCICNFKSGIMSIDASKISTVRPSRESCLKMRASINLLGAFLARTGKCSIPFPGGCKIGGRPIDIHISGLTKLGADIEHIDDMIEAQTQGLLGTEFRLPFPSVGATENMVIASVLAHGTTKLINCATEPEIEDLCDYLLSMGADISGAGTHIITVRGVSELHDTVFNIPGDRIVAGTYMAACAITGGNMQIKNIIPSRLTAVTEVLRNMGCHIYCVEGTDFTKNEIRITADGRRRPVPNISTGPHPQFPTDMQSQIMSVLATSEGISTIDETIFETRFNTIDELNRMGAMIICHERRAVITGVERLNGCDTTALDLRGGAALVLAALGANGRSRIRGCHHIFRGYENLCEDLNKLGADISWVEEDTQNIDEEVN